MPRVATTTWPSSARSPCPASAGKAPRRTSWREGERVTAPPRGVSGSRSSDRPRGDSLTPSPLSHSVGEGMTFVWGRAKPPPHPRVAAARRLPNPSLALSDGDGGSTRVGGSSSPASPDCRWAAASRERHLASSGGNACRGKARHFPGLGVAVARSFLEAALPLSAVAAGEGQAFPRAPELPWQDGFPPDVFPCQAMIEGLAGGTFLPRAPGCRGAGPRVSGDAGRGGREAADGSGRTPRAVGVPRGSGIR